MLNCLLLLLLIPASHSDAAGMATNIHARAFTPVPGWGGVVSSIYPSVMQQSSLNPQLIGLNGILGTITTRLAVDEASGLKSMEFVRFMADKYQADPAAFATQTEARQVAGLLKGVLAAGRALDKEATVLSPKLAAGTASAAERDRLTAIRENSFYLSSAVRRDVEDAFAREASPDPAGSSASALDKVKRISREKPIQQGAAFDGEHHSPLGARESSAVLAEGSKGARKNTLALRPYRPKSDARGGIVTTDPSRIENQVIRLPNGTSFSVRPGGAEDAVKVTALIHDAFSIWKEQGLNLGPMHQTEEQTAAHLVGKGYVAENSHGELSGTFSLDNGAVRAIGKTKVRFTEGGDSIDYPRIDGAKTILPAGRLLVFKKAAVDRNTANSGLGSELYALAEKHAREKGYSGMILETVKEAGWLYDWYLRLGFKPIGSYRYPGRQIDTILMIKSFRGDK